MRVVTISRQFGAGGSEIARRVAESLGWTLLDNALVERVAASLGTTPAQVESVEHAPSLAQRIATALAFSAQEPLTARLPRALPPTEERLLDVTRRVVDEAVARGPVVLVGRGAQAWLASRADAFHVLCSAPRDALIARVAGREGLSEQEAAQLVDDVNGQRAQFVRRHWGREWLDPSHYHLALNTAWLGIDAAVALIVDEVRRR
jgi:cytidylate kinase